MSEKIRPWVEGMVSDDLLKAVEGVLGEAEVTKGDDEEYDKAFKAAMKKFGIDDITDLKTDAEKKKFFDYVDSQHTSDAEESGKEVEPEDKVKKEENEVTLSPEEEKRIQEILNKEDGE